MSKEALGPKQKNLLIWIGLKNCFKMKKLKIASEIFLFYKFWKSFVFSVHAAETEDDAGKLGKPSFLKIGITYLLDGVIQWISCKMGHPTHCNIVNISSRLLFVEYLLMEKELFAAVHKYQTQRKGNKDKMTKCPLANTKYKTPCQMYFIR